MRDQTCEAHCPVCGSLCDGRHPRAGPYEGMHGHPGRYKNSERHFFGEPMEVVHTVSA